MTFYIRIPANSDRYSLVSDLNEMASDIAGHLEVLSNQINLAVVNGSSPTFTSVSTTTNSQFPGVIVTGPESLSSLINTSDGFGLKSNTLKFTTTDQAKWVSNGHIDVPDGGSGTNAINLNTFNLQIASRDSAISTLNTQVNTLINDKASVAYVNAQVTALQNSINNITGTANNVTTKANYYENVNRVQSAAGADYASSAGTANIALNSNKLAGRSLAVGSFNAGSVAAGNSVTSIIHHGLGYVPAILASAVADAGVVSIVCSVGDVTTTTAEIKYRNINTSTSETCWINWVAI